VVSSALTTTTEKEKLQSQTPECGSRESTKAMDLRINVGLSRLWDKMYWEVAGKSLDFGAPGDFAGREVRGFQRLSVQSDVAR
jgi:hypothetical protein